MTNPTIVHQWEPGPISGAVAGFAANLRFSEAPADVRAATTAVLAQTIARARAGADSAVAGRLRSYATACSSPPEAHVIAPGEASVQCSAMHAALINGASAATHVHDLADAVIPAGLASAELANVELETLLSAVLAGLEIAQRCAIGLGSSHSGRGWDIVSTAGRIGASACAGRIFSLSSPSIVDAIGYASTSAAGLRQRAGSTTLAVAAGKAAADGIESALLARAGLIGPPAPLEGRRGLFALEDGDDAEKLAVELGSRSFLVEHWSGLESDAVGDAIRAIIAAPNATIGTIITAACQ